MHTRLLPSCCCRCNSFSLLICFIFMIILSPASSLFAAGSSFQNCSSEVIRCGNQRDIGYPFWGMNRPDYCGYPGFQLNCTDDDQLELTIMYQSYRVVRIDDDSQTVTVARTDYLQNLCPTLLVNNTLNHTLFLEVPDDTANITLYYNCRSATLNSFNYFSSFTCSINGSDLINYYTTNENLDQLMAAVRVCRDTVVLQADRTQVQNLANSIPLNTDNLIRTLGTGFPLRWSADNSLCDNCRDSGGECGQNISSGVFRCFCNDGDGFNNICPGGDNGSGIKTLPIALGIVGGGIALVLLLVLLVLFVIKQRKRNAVQSRNSNDLSSLPTSKPPSAPSLQLNQRTYSNHYSKSAIETSSSYFGTQVFSYSDLAAATDNFNHSKELGDGGFGAVYFGILGDGREVAVKRLYEKNFKRVEQFMNEVEILTRLHHPNLVQLYGCTSRHSRELILVYEYIANGTVADHLHGNRSKSNFLTWPIRLSIAIETANALLYLHMSDIIHRDVKTTNILLDSYFHVKVADFGLSRSLPTDVTHVSTAPQGTPGYVDPEYYRCFKLTDKSDVYSFGVVLVELLSGKEAVDTNRHRDDVSLASMAMNKIQNHALHELVDPSLGFETDYNTRRMIISVTELAFRCLQQDRDMRPAMEEVLETLKDIQNIELSSRRKAEEMDIRSADDVGLLKQISPPLSPDTVATTNLMQIRTV